MKVFFDTEFTGLHQNTTLISIGLVKEDGSTFYAQFTDFDLDQLDSWLIENVMNNMIFDWTKYNKNENLTLNENHIYYIGDKKYILDKLLDFLGKDEKIEFWSDCLSYDWILLNELWNGALNIPKNFYYIPFDICTLFKIKGIDPDISREVYIVDNEVDFYTFPKDKIFKHNALWDALVIKQCYEKLMKE